MSLANKYRPANFDMIIGQDHITDILKEQMKKQDEIHHNYLLFGLRGTGKTSAARILAKALNCTNLQNGNPCNTCANCTSINKGETLDYVEIDAASHTGVDNIREEILAKAIYPPTQLKKKIYIIDEVHMLSTGAFNALLKTIEEPRDNVCFILATTEIHKIPDTIISRCQVFNFKKIPAEKMTQHLASIAEKENLQYEESALDLISKISEGSVRDAVKYVDQISILGNLNEEHVSKFLGIASEGILKDLVALIQTGDKTKIFEEIEKIHAGGVDMVQFTKQLIIYLDKTMTTDTMDFNLQLSEAISEILSKIRYYPYPTVIYKIVLNSFVNDTLNTSQKIIDQDTQTAHIPVETKKHTSVENNQKNNTSGGELKQEGGKPEEKQTANPKNVESPSPDDDNKSQIRDKVLAKAENESFGVTLKKYCKLETADNDAIIITTINKMAELSLKREDNLKKLQGYFSELGIEGSVEIVFKNKEDFLKEGML